MTDHKKAVNELFDKELEDNGIKYIGDVSEYFPIFGVKAVKAMLAKAIGNAYSEGWNSRGKVLQEDTSKLVKELEYALSIKP